MRGRPEGALTRGATPGLILDVLMTDGGWLTTSAIQAALPLHNATTIQRALFRLKDRGWIEARERQLNEAHEPGRKGPIPNENEWRSIYE